MSDIKFDIKMTKQDLAQLQKELGEIAGPILGQTVKALSKEILEIPAVQKFAAFMNTKQFREDFGIFISDAKDMRNRFLEAISNIQIVKLSKDGSVKIKIVDEDELRAATLYKWTSIRLTSKKRAKKAILVNAWDIYENGIVAGEHSGIILGYRKNNKLKSVINQGLSRSGSALMVRTTGPSFGFFYGAAPRGTQEIKSALRKKYGRE